MGQTHLKVVKTRLTSRWFSKMTIEGKASSSFKVLSVEKKLKCWFSTRSRDLLQAISVQSSPEHALMKNLIPNEVLLRYRFLFESTQDSGCFRWTSQRLTPMLLFTAKFYSMVTKFSFNQLNINEVICFRNQSFLRTKCSLWKNRSNFAFVFNFKVFWPEILTGGFSLTDDLRWIFSSSWCQRKSGRDHCPSTGGHHGEADTAP